MITNYDLIVVIKVNTCDELSSNYMELKFSMRNQQPFHKYCETQPFLKKKIVIHVMCEKSWIENSVTLRVVDLQMYPLKMTG